MLKINETLLRKAIGHYGKGLQSIVAMEEMAELQKEISKALRGKFNEENMTEEIADVLIMIEQLKIIYDITDDMIEDQIYNKKCRLEFALKDIHE